jgi:hypothetical protein
LGYAVGDIAPSFTALDQSGNEVSLRDFAGSFVLLDFSSVWCAPCNEFARDVQPQIAQDLRARGIPFTTITILLDGGTPGAPSTLRNAQIWAERYKLSEPVVTVNGDANSPLYAQFAAYSDPLSPPSGAYPTFVALGPDQRILAIPVGGPDPDPAKPDQGPAEWAQFLEAPFIESLTQNLYYEFVVFEYTFYNVGLPGSVVNDLYPEVSELAKWLAKGNAKKTRDSLDSFLFEVEDLAAKFMITPEQAFQLESIANTILDTLGG